jgi:CubicO group peptidase (beta-lactamase class C family)
VVRGGAFELFHGHGVADVATGTPVTEDTVFRVASITKTFTAIAVMQLWEQGLVDLDAPANDVLRAYRLIPADIRHRPATLRHLLTHTAGISENVPRSSVLRRDFGESVRVGRRLPTLAAHYGGGLRLDAEPGTRFRYTDHGPATLGQIVEDVSGQPFDRYLRQHVFQPLGMTDTEVVRSERVRARLATGYTLRARGASAVTERDWITTGASSAFSTSADMARYIAALANGGANEHGTVLKPATLAAMFAPQYQPDPRIPGVGLAFFRSTVGGHPVVEHQGILPGFDSQIFVAPDDGVGVMAFSNGTRLGMLWMPTELSSLLATLLGVPDAAIRTDIAQRPEIWHEVCGWYHLAGPITDLRVRAMVGAGVEVLVRRGQLVLRALAPVPALARGVPLHPDDDADPYVFRIDLTPYGLGTIRAVFGRPAMAGAPTTLHLDVMPLSATRQAAATNPRLWANGVATVAMVLAVRRRATRRRAARRRRHSVTAD